ncbi:MAG: tRNA (adenosine(37)-N6)-dimethylallyltransferase MiaA [Porticoccaceae bacterium]|nr:tRNA (adenosine(37)-N6)-dimethylallyltransferase MiaA [Porticoccaceae bacterium]
MSSQPGNLPRAIFVMGPTASGKTDLAIELRKHLPVELINVDSAQVYRQLNIGSAKPDAETLEAAPHRLLDIRDPSQAYNAADFLADAKTEMEEIVESGKIPLLVGGSMMYFKVLLEGLSDLPEANQQIRDELEQRASVEGWPSLYTELQQVDPVTASRLHPNHSQRIQRALEIYRITGVAMSSLQGSSVGGLQDYYDIVQFSLIPQNRSQLHNRIEFRFKQMMELGFEREVQNLYLRGDLHVNLPAIRSVGYRQLWDYCAGECNLSEAVEKGVIATRQLAKRQMTWLRNWPKAIEIKVDNQSGYLSTEEICAQCLKML